MIKKVTPVEIRTLQDHVNHRHSLALHCKACRHFKNLDLEALIADERFGPDWEPTPEKFRHAFRCSKCGSKDLGVQVGGPATADR